MDNEQTQTVLTTLTRIDTRQEAIKEMLDRHETQVNDIVLRVNEHDTKFARMRGGMSVLGMLFTLLVAVGGFLQFWK